MSSDFLLCSQAGSLIEFSFELSGCARIGNEFEMKREIWRIFGELKSLFQGQGNLVNAPNTPKTESVVLHVKHHQI